MRKNRKRASDKADTKSRVGSHRRRRRRELYDQGFNLLMTIFIWLLFLEPQDIAPSKESSVTNFDRLRRALSKTSSSKFVSFLYLNVLC